jgi:hypothetical protein
VVPKARPMPLQSFAQRTVSHLPHGIRRSLLKLARPEFAGDFTATTEVEARRRRRLQRSGWLAFAATLLALLVWIESGLGVSYRDSLPVRAVLRASSPTRRSCRPRSGLLSWGSSKIAPPPVQMPRVLSWTSRGPSFGPKLPNSGRVPPLPFFPTTAVYSARHPAGLLHPASGHGVRQVSGLLPALCPKAWGLGARLSLWRFTLRSFPLRSRPMRVTARRFPLAVARSLWSWVLPCCHVWPRARPHVARPQGFAPLRSPLRARQRCHRRTARYSLGLGPRLVLMPSRRRSKEWRAAGPLRSRGTAEDWPGDSAASPPRRGGSGRRPMHGLVGPWPRGASVRCVRRADGPRGVRPCRRLAGHPGVAAPPAPWLAEPEGSGAPRVGRV